MIHNARLPIARLPDFAACLDVQPTGDTVRQCYKSLSLPSYAGRHTHTLQVPGPATGDRPSLVSCLLSKNPAHHQHSTCRLSEQADGTAISSLSPRMSHHQYAWLCAWLKSQSCLPHHDTPEGDHEPAIPRSAPHWLQRANGSEVTCCSVSGRSAAASVTHIPP